ncbi:DUF4123 domain-containing protein [Wielerella bovis]|uniref:DUF4123 domain-containing protein n=1 Tax=Wielerella bovis TaxID=2917790 RepID=UPI002018BA75|nr:DUF4123 domain-containing protein [Wielerella bovis]ULJ64497.1 DUF4123 domain-containing protein [Wielerella bovis]
MFYDQKSKWYCLDDLSGKTILNNLYLLCNLGGFGRGVKALLNPLKNNEQCSLFFGLPEDDYHQIRPMIFKIELPSQMLIVQNILQVAKYEDKLQYFVLIESQYMSVGDLQTHLKKFLHGQLKSGRTALVRFYDPVVFTQLEYIWPFDEQKIFWQPLDAWHLWNDNENVGISFIKENHD